jgi:hypothetical protein
VRMTALVQQSGNSVSERVLRPKEWIFEPNKAPIPPAPGTRAADDFESIKARLDELRRDGLL